MARFNPGPFPSRSALLLLLPLLLAAPAVAHDDEIGAPSDGPVSSLDIPPLTFDVSVSYGYDLLVEDDMRETYQGLPSLGVEFSVGMGERSALFVSARTGSTTGDPFYDDPTFEGGVDSELEIVPLAVGMKANASDHPRLPIWLGAAFTTVWCRETLPSSLLDSAAAVDHDGWGTGFLLTIQPQWRSEDDGLGVGLEFEYGGADVDYGGWGGTAASTAHVAARLVVSKRL